VTIRSSTSAGKLGTGPDWFEIGVVGQVQDVSVSRVDSSVQSRQSLAGVTIAFAGS